MRVCGIEITSPDKILFKKDKITKLDVVNYYCDVAHLILPKLKNRPVSVIRCHDDIFGEKFFKKHPTTEGDKIGYTIIDDEKYFCISNVRQLILQVQMGTIEFHTWGCKVPNIEKPDKMIFDLDPDENLSLTKLRDGVKKLKSVLDQLHLQSEIKTSGGKGYHIVVPFKYKKGWEDFSSCAQQIAQVLENKWPNLFTSNMRKDNRDGKIFVDYLRNKRGASCVCAYSLRARENAPISLPIDWEKLSNIRPSQITLKNYKRYIKE